MRVICINDKGKPNEIPTSKWIKKDEEYTILEIIKCNIQGGLLGVKLVEIDLTGCEPYLYFAANRFAPAVSDTELVEDNVEELVV
jgi:hypothetical protein